MYKEQDCLMYYSMVENEDGTVMPKKNYITPPLAIMMLLRKLNLELTGDENDKPILKKAKEKVK